MTQTIKFQDYHADLNNQVRLGAIRWLHGIDLDWNSISHGIADREYWAWKTKDFANGTWQGGLSALLDASLWLSLTEEQLRRIVQATVQGTRRIQRGNGSFEEAYPLESSYCVTALVVLDLLDAFYRYERFFDIASQKELSLIVQDGLAFIERTPETHGIIANHVATAVVAVQLARQFLELPKASQGVQEFLKLQHAKEGWFPEYNGADPGYQTLLNHYLLLGCLNLKEVFRIPELEISLGRSCGFTEKFCFPDGSFAEEAGSRGTGIVYPSGTFSVAGGKVSPTALTGWWLERYFARLEAVTPTNVDAGNFVPVFNSWALFARLLAERGEAIPTQDFSRTEDVDYPEAGLYVRRTPEAMLVVSKPNAVMRRVVKGEAGWRDDSIVAFSREGLTTQGTSPVQWRLSDSCLSWQYQAIPRNQSLNAHWKAIVLRFLSLLTVWSPPLQRGMKKLLAKVVMGRPQSGLDTPLYISIDLKDPRFSVQVDNMVGWECHSAGFHQHMASANSFKVQKL